jgi:hypothetical protein
LLFLICYSTARYLSQQFGRIYGGARMRLNAHHCLRDSMRPKLERALPRGERGCQCLLNGSGRCGQLLIEKGATHDGARARGRPVVLESAQGCAGSNGADERR